MQFEEQAAGADQEEGTAQPSGIQSLAELLAADEQQGSGEPEGEPSGSNEKAQLKKFNDLAGKLGVKLDDLYKLEINSSEGGESVTIEQLKDLHKSKSDFDLGVIEFEERRTQQEQELMRAQAELQEILQALPKNSVKPEVLDRIRQRSEQTTRLERQKTLEVIPEWKDAKVRETEIAGMTEHLQAYGFPTSYLSNVVNHRQLKYIRDNWKREQRIRKALEQVRAGKPEPKPKAKPAGKAPVKNPVTSIRRGNSPNRLAEAFSSLKE